MHNAISKLICLQPAATEKSSYALMWFDDIIKPSRDVKSTTVFAISSTRKSRNSFFSMTAKIIIIIKDADIF